MRAAAASGPASPDRNQLRSLNEPSGFRVYPDSAVALLSGWPWRVHAVYPSDRHSPEIAPQTTELGAAAITPWTSAGQ